ncbi:contactin-associated protein-like 5 [Ochotona princeps]|uniref:contactin-associated protein-like 5 n=1 Tax=Ochotona princeps TaxID=9978 RepID=UPI002714972E|nr:contactin-associated protein-like 5 [Ochotona princeps]
MYEQSCEVYRHQGNTAGLFYIDSDGSEPLAPLQVYCNITEDKNWTTVQHNNEELTPVQGYMPEKSYTMTLDYGGSMEQLEALIDSTEHCKHVVAYHCRRSHLVNTAENYSDGAVIPRPDMKSGSGGKAGGDPSSQGSLSAKVVLLDQEIGEGLGAGDLVWNSPPPCRR